MFLFKRRPDRDNDSAEKIPYQFIGQSVWTWACLRQTGSILICPSILQGFPYTDSISISRWLLWVDWVTIVNVSLLNFHHKNHLHYEVFVMTGLYNNFNDFILLALILGKETPPSQYLTFLTNCHFSKLTMIEIHNWYSSMRMHGTYILYLLCKVKPLGSLPCLSSMPIFTIGIYLGL